MSHENVEIVRGIYDAWARDEFPGPADVLDAEIEYVNPPGAVEPGTRYGLEAFTRAVEQVFVEGWESWRFEAERFTPCGDQVAVVLGYRARGRGSRVEVDGRLSALWTLRGGKVVRFEWFHGADEAVEAMGNRDGIPYSRRRTLAPPHPRERFLSVVEADAHLDDLASN